MSKFTDILWVSYRQGFAQHVEHGDGHFQVTHLDGLPLGEGLTHQVMDSPHHQLRVLWVKEPNYCVPVSFTHGPTGIFKIYLF